MVYLQITEAVIPDGKTHLSTDWQIATDLLFNNVIVESLDDENYLNDRVFNTVLTAGVKYYGRARIKLDTGYGPWGNIDVFVVDDSNDITRTVSAPSRITPPTITTSSVFDKHTASFFTIYATGFSVVGNSKHIATNWMITDINNNIIWFSINDDDNLNSINVGNLLLDNNKIYNIKVSFVSDSGDVSQTTSKILSVDNGNEFTLNANLTSIDVNEKLTVGVSAYGTINLSRFKIAEILNNKIHIIYNQSTSNPTLDIPANTMVNNKRYTLIVNATIDNVPSTTKYVNFTTY